MDKKHYNAFISYSHHEKKIAQKIQKSLEKINIPVDIRKEMQIKNKRLDVVIDSLEFKGLPSNVVSAEEVLDTKTKKIYKISSDVVEERENFKGWSGEQFFLSESAGVTKYDIYGRKKYCINCDMENFQSLYTTENYLIVEFENGFEKFINLYHSENGKFINSIELDENEYIDSFWESKDGTGIMLTTDRMLTINMNTGSICQEAKNIVSYNPNLDLFIGENDKNIGIIKHYTLEDIKNILNCEGSN